ncbi:MAG TPA: nucleotide exchange factor GrpE [Pyrinomonadaceae bacterium]
MAKDRFGRELRDTRDDDNPGIRVTDRRRIQLDDDQERDTNVDVQPPSLKPHYVEELEARTKAAEDKVLEVNARFEQLRKHLQRETDETRQRLNKAADERAAREKADFVAGLLPVLDNLVRAEEAATAGVSAENIAEGVRQTAASFLNALANTGVEPIEAVGQQFDPQVHEAVEIAEVDPEEDGKVLAEYSKGYRIGDRLLRPAKVKVGTRSQRAGSDG